ncbi:hypothetical protein B6D60_01490 [candidate division KSB1 bacterium 4484_87]|nr:MAG: hypothetical protein B6D60_01490 [candidate division KSB1 bacterium 4484_87]
MKKKPVFYKSLVSNTKIRKSNHYCKLKIEKQTRRVLKFRKFSDCAMEGSAFSKNNLVNLTENRIFEKCALDFY